MVESNFNTEKNQGYSFSHCFSYNWNAMKAYHYLMKFAHFFNTLVAYSGLSEVSKPLYATARSMYLKFVQWQKRKQTDGKW